jgi:hypothetical protein
VILAGGLVFILLWGSFAFIYSTGLGVTQANCHNRHAILQHPSGNHNGAPGLTTLLGMACPNRNALRKALRFVFTLRIEKLLGRWGWFDEVKSTPSLHEAYLAKPRRTKIYFTAIHNFLKHIFQFKKGRHFAGQCVVLPKSSSVGMFRMPVLMSGGKILSHSFCKDGG